MRGQHGNPLGPELGGRRDGRGARAHRHLSRSAGVRRPPAGGPAARLDSIRPRRAL